MLKIDLLGPLSLERDGVRVALPQSRKARALLAYLTVTGKPHRRDRLIAMFWDIPDDPRSALRWTLTKLRGLVDDDARKRIVADRETVAFDPTDVEIDLDRVRALMDRRGLAKTDTIDLEGAARLFRGPFLEGLELPDCFEFQAWAVAEREEAQILHQRVLEALRDRLRDEPDRALPHARRLVELDPYDESARVALVRLLLDAGRRQEAEEQYRSGSRLLDEAGPPGATELRRVWSELREGAVAAPRRPGALPADADVDDDPRWQADDFRETAALLKRPAVAVLPFANVSGDPAQDYIADGITEDIITSLGLWRWFPVISRISTFGYKGRAVDAATVGEELGARYIVEGSVRRAADRIRVNAQLVDVETGHQLWAQRFDGELGDVFALQDEITEQIVTHLEPQIARAERRRAERKSPQQLDVWDLNLRALYHIRRARPEDFAAAEALLAQSEALDPDASDTQALRALCLYHQALLGWVADPVACSGTYLDITRRAVGLDESNWLAHSLLSISVLWHLRDYETAAHAAERAVALNPSAAIAHQFLGCVHLFDGSPEKAIPSLHAAIRLNPNREAVTLLFADLALAHLLIGEYREAAGYARRAIAEFSGDVRAWQRLVAALGLLGETEEAARALRDLEKRQRNLSTAYIEATYPFRYRRDHDLLIEGLRKAGWREDAAAAGEAEAAEAPARA